MKNKVGVIILNWNGLDDTAECLNSLIKVTYQKMVVYLIDNGSENNELPILKKQFENKLNIKFIQNRTNLGFAGGCNVGIKKALDDGCSNILLLNNDTIVKPDFIDQLVEVSSADNIIGVVGSKIYLYDEPHTIWASATYFNYLFPPFSKMINTKNPVAVNSIIGCSMMIKSDVFKKIGLFDEDYFAYGEEDDFNMRAIRAGFILKHCPDSIVWHKVSRSTGGGFNSRVAYLKMRNKIMFAKKNYTLTQWPTYALFLVLYFVKSQVKVLLKFQFKTSLALAKGFRDGLKI